MRKLPRYHSLVAWQRADDLFIRLHRLSRQTIPQTERYELGAQLRRAAFSVPANIVEGTARYHRKERRQFLRTSLSSLAEVGYCLHVARRLEYLSQSEHEALDLEVRRTAAPLLGLIRRCRNAGPGAQRRAPSRGRRDA